MNEISRKSFIMGMLAGSALLVIPGVPFAEPITLRMRELYNKDLSFSDQALALQNSRVQVKGFMAPPLKAESNFFVLTKRPMAVCPFCETDAEWPDDILAVYTKRILDIVPFNVPIVTNGILELGSYTDPETGFVSRIRLNDSIYMRV